METGIGSNSAFCVSVFLQQLFICNPLSSSFLSDSKVAETTSILCNLLVVYVWWAHASRVETCMT